MKSIVTVLMFVLFVLLPFTSWALQGELTSGMTGLKTGSTKLPYGLYKVQYILL